MLTPKKKLYEKGGVNVEKYYSSSVSRESKEKKKQINPIQIINIKKINGNESTIPYQDCNCKK